MRSSFVAIAVVGGVALGGGMARAHFALQAPACYSQQDNLGLPLKSAPCGQADPGTPVVATNAVSTFHAGDTITVTVNETIFHPGHYRVSLAPDQSSLPSDPTVTADANSPCGSAEIQSSAVTGVIVDNMLPHTAAFTGPQSFQVTLPNTTCTNCTLQVIEFMGDHSLNNPGGCFYHHCAQVNLVAPGTPIPDAGVGGGGSATADGGLDTPPTTSGGCDAGSGASASLALMLVALVALLRRR